jgi:hypothetical protein
LPQDLRPAAALLDLRPTLAAGNISRCLVVVEMVRRRGRFAIYVKLVKEHVHMHVFYNDQIVRQYSNERKQNTSDKAADPILVRSAKGQELLGVSIIS